MKTKKTITSQEDIDAMADASGEKELKQAPKYVLPSLKLNGRDGGFFRTVIENNELVLNDDGKALLEEVKSPTGVVLRVRKSFTQDGADIQVFSSEGGNSPKTIFSLFEKMETKNGTSLQMVDQGTASQIKVRHPEVKMVQIIYFLLSETNEIVRLKVKGKGLGEVFAYWNEFADKEHSFQFTTILGQKAGKNKFGSFFINTFKKGAKIEDLSNVKAAMDEVNAKVNAIDEFYEERNKEMEDFREGKEFEVPEAEIEIVDKKEIKEKLKATSDKIIANSEEDEEIDTKKIFD